MMNLVQTIPVGGVSSTGAHSEFVTVALFAAVGMLASVVAVMNGIVPVVAWF